MWDKVQYWTLRIDKKKLKSFLVAEIPINLWYFKLCSISDEVNNASSYFASQHTIYFNRHLHMVQRLKFYLKFSSEFKKLKIIVIEESKSLMSRRPPIYFCHSVVTLKRDWCNERFLSLSKVFKISAQWHMMCPNILVAFLNNSTMITRHKNDNNQ